MIREGSFFIKIGQMQSEKKKRKKKGGWGCVVSPICRPSHSTYLLTYFSTLIYISFQTKQSSFIKNKNKNGSDGTPAPPQTQTDPKTHISELLCNACYVPSHNYIPMRLIMYVDVCSP